MRPSWITVTASVPSLAEDEAFGDARVRRAPTGSSGGTASHSSARNGRWNHIAWSRLAIMNSVSSYEMPCGIIAVSSIVRSDA